MEKLPEYLANYIDHEYGYKISNDILEELAECIKQGLDAYKSIYGESGIEPKVTIAIMGGVAEIVSVPEGVDLEIRDYDIEGTECERLSVDDQGTPFVIQRGLIMANGRMLLNKKHVRDYILKRQSEVRPGWNFTSVGNVVYDDLNEKVRLWIDAALRRHPSNGKTFREIM